MYQVEGTVHYTDGSIPTGGVCVVNFQPSENSTADVRRGASSAIEADGTFTLWTRTPGDGVYAGEYDVSFVILKSPTDPQSLILPKYSSPSTSGYKVEVDRHIRDLRFEIEPQPGAPRAAHGSGQASQVAGR